jgi:hypothetical protein
MFRLLNEANDIEISNQSPLLSTNQDRLQEDDLRTDSMSDVSWSEQTTDRSFDVLDQESHKITFFIDLLTLMVLGFVLVRESVVTGQARIECGIDPRSEL